MRNTVPAPVHEAAFVRHLGHAHLIATATGAVEGGLALEIVPWPLPAGADRDALLLALGWGRREPWWDACRGRADLAEVVPLAGGAFS